MGADGIYGAKNTKLSAIVSYLLTHLLTLKCTRQGHASPPAPPIKMLPAPLPCCTWCFKKWFYTLPEMTRQSEEVLHTSLCC